MKRPSDISPDQSIPLLKALHILTRDGKLNQDSRRKLKQVNHLVNFIKPLVEEIYSQHESLTIVDHGAGKSYLGFILYDILLKSHAYGEVIGIESRTELVERSKALAIECDFHRMRFEGMTVADSMVSNELPGSVDIVTALHACDTATDDAIQFGLAKKAKFMVLVPCCQAEVAKYLRANKNLALSETPLSEIWRHPIHTREFGSQLTNVLRCLQLEASGYQLTVTELVGWEHSMKNELIIAKYTGQKRSNALARMQAILAELKLEELNKRFSVSY